MARGGMNINVSCYTIKLAFWPWLLPHSLLKNGSREPGWMTSLCLYTTLSVKSGIIRYWVYFINLRRQRMYTSPVIIVYTSQSVSQSVVHFDLMVAAASLGLRLCRRAPSNAINFLGFRRPPLRPVRFMGRKYVISTIRLSSITDRARYAETQI